MALNVAAAVRHQLRRLWLLFGALFSDDLEVLPSPVDPLSVGPSMWVHTMIVLSAVEAFLHGSPMLRGSVIVKAIEESTSIFCFALPHALKDGRHSTPLVFSFTALVALTLRLKYMHPTHCSTTGGDAISIVFEKFESGVGVAAILPHQFQTGAPLPRLDFCNSRHCCFEQKL